MFSQKAFENSFEILLYMKKHLKLCFEVKVSFESEISFEIMFWLDMKIQKKYLNLCFDKRNQSDQYHSGASSDAFLGSQGVE